MMKNNKINTINKILKEKLIAVIRADSEKTAIELVEAVYKGGINLIEITMTVTGAVDIIKKISAKYSSEGVIIGAGTVLDSETARLCILNGAEFIVSPVLNIPMVKLCNRYGVAVIPGVTTPTEAVTALEYGVDMVKLFPAVNLGVSAIKNFKGPLPQLNIMPAGGINRNNAEEWLRAGASAIGIGGDLTTIENGDYGSITEKARQYVDLVK